jgi:Arylmalonate decarboxylase
MKDASGRPATTAATAFVDALTLLGAEAIAIPAPWSKITDKLMAEFMEANGFAVVHSEVPGFVASIELGRVDPERGRDHHAWRQLGLDSGRWAVGERTWQADPRQQCWPAYGRVCVSSNEATAFAAMAGCCATILRREWPWYKIPFSSRS